MLIVLGRDQVSFYEFLKPRQERDGKTRVLLDRRIADRRGAAANGRVNERRAGDRRVPTSDAARAAMSVLGFIILHPEETGPPH